jgi:Polyketide cyclase / dehydrase and lipid transport
VAHNQIQVAVPPSVVFAVLADAARYRDWVVGAKEILSSEGGWPVPGASFRHRFGLGPAAVSDLTTVLAADPPAELVLVACFGPVGAAEVRLQIDPSGAGSLVTMEERPVSGPLGAVRGARLLDLIIHLRNAASLRRLRRLAQGQGEPSTARDS